jgi:hypothetical protein
VRTHAELRHIGLPDGNGAGLLDALDEQRIFRADDVFIDRRSLREPKPDRGFEVLERRRQSVQRTNRVAAGDRVIGGFRQLETGVVIQLRDDGVEVWVEAIDLR